MNIDIEGPSKEEANQLNQLRGKPKEHKFLSAIGRILTAAGIICPVAAIPQNPIYAQEISSVGDPISILQISTETVEQEAISSKFYPSLLRHSAKQEAGGKVYGEVSDGLGYKVQGDILKEYQKRGEVDSPWGFVRTNSFVIDELRTGQLFANALVMSTKQDDGTYQVEEIPVMQKLEEAGLMPWVEANLPAGKDSFAIWQVVMATHFLENFMNAPVEAYIPQPENGSVYPQDNQPYPARINGEHIDIINLGAKHGIISADLKTLDDYLAFEGIDKITLITTDYKDELPFSILRRVSVGLIDEIERGVYTPGRSLTAFDQYFALEVPPESTFDPLTSPEFKHKEIDQRFNGSITAIVSALSVFQKPTLEWPTSSNDPVWKKIAASEAAQRNNQFIKENIERDFIVLRFAPPS